MFGAGSDVFAVWGYVIANTVDSRVELNPHLLASILGSTPTAVEKAIVKLCQPDPKSRNREAKGRRLQKEGQFQYRVTSHQIYREMKNEEQRRTYNREKQRESRARRRLQQPVNSVNLDGQSMSTPSIHTEAEAEAKAESEKEIPRIQQQASLGDRGTTTSGAKSANPPAAPTARSKRPIFTGQRLVVFEWQLDDLSRLLDRKSVV